MSHIPPLLIVVAGCLLVLFILACIYFYKWAKWRWFEKEDADEWMDHF